MVGALADHGYEVIALSRFGYLRSKVKETTMSVTTQADAYVDCAGARDQLALKNGIQFR